MTECPTQMQVLHAAWEEAWVLHDKADNAGIARMKRSISEPCTSLMERIAAKAQRLALSILVSKPVSQADLAILLTHIYSETDPDMLPSAERASAIEVATGTALTFILQTVEPPAGRVANIICEAAVNATNAMMDGRFADLEEAA